MDPNANLTNQNNTGSDFMVPPAATPEPTGVQEQSQEPDTNTPGPSTLSTVAENVVNPPPTDGGHTISTVNAGSGSSGGHSPKKLLATILGIALLVVGVGAGVILVRQPTQFRTSAWDCEKYNFAVSQDGVVTINNESNRNEPLQMAKVYINSVEVATFDVPNLNAGSSATLGNVSVPNTEFNWQVIGSKDCSDSGSFGPKETPKPPEYETQIDCSGGYIKNTSDQNISGIFEQFDPYFKKEFNLAANESVSQNWQGDLTPDTTFIYIEVTGVGRIAGEHYPSNCSTATPTVTPTATPTVTPSPTPGACFDAGCNEVKAYLVTGSVTNAANWELLTATQLSNLVSGDKVYFTVSGNAAQGTITKARFRVNSDDWDIEVADKKPGSGEFYYLYTVPSGVYTFEVNAQVHHGELDIWM